MDDRIPALTGFGRIQAARREHRWLPLLRLVFEALVGPYERPPAQPPASPAAAPGASRRHRMRREPLIERD